MRFLTILGILLLSQTGWTEYLAYSVSEDGNRPLPENIENIEAKYLLNIEWGSFAGGKSRLGVLEVDNTSSAGSYTIVGGVGFSSGSVSQVPVNGIEAIVTDTLARTNRFRLVERRIKGARTFWQAGSRYRPDGGMDCRLDPRWRRNPGG